MVEERHWTNLFMRYVQYAAGKCGLSNVAGLTASERIQDLLAIHNFSLLLKQIFYDIICCLVFLPVIQKEPRTPLPTPVQKGPQ